MELIVDYEVYGNWNTKESAGHCPKCAAKLQLVPEEGHYNSQYWKLKQNDGLDLYCCPTGCDANFKQKIIENFKPIDEKILKYFYMMHNVEIDKRISTRLGYMIENHTNSCEDHKKQTHYIMLKDFVYFNNGFGNFHADYYDNKSSTEFMIDTISGIVFFNIYSHEPFASRLYRPLYERTVSNQGDILDAATKDGLCIWESTVSSQIFGLDECEDKLILAKFGKN